MHVMQVIVRTIRKKRRSLVLPRWSIEIIFTRQVSEVLFFVWNSNTRRRDTEPSTSRDNVDVISNLEPVELFSYVQRAIGYEAVPHNKEETVFLLCLPTDSHVTTSCDVGGVRERAEPSGGKSDKHFNV